MFFALQRILGHNDLPMTKGYLALTQEDSQKEHEKRIRDRDFVDEGSV